MAGLLIKELLIRGDLERCLIVAPGSLVGLGSPGTPPCGLEIQAVLALFRMQPPIRARQNLASVPTGLIGAASRRWPVSGGARAVEPMDQSIPPFRDGESVTLMSTKVPHASILQTSVHGCDAPVADVTRVLRTCVPPA
jgi:hypothetical protein